METKNIRELRKEVFELKEEVEHLKMIVEEDYDLADDVVAEIEESKRRPRSAFVSHEAMRKEFGG